MTNSILLERRFTLNGVQDFKEIQRRRIFILPTRNGILFGSMLLVLLIGAINYDNNLAYSLTFLLSSLTLVAIFYTYKNLAGLIITPTEPKPVFLGETIRFPFKTDNLFQEHRYSIITKNQIKSDRWFRLAKTISVNKPVDIRKNSVSILFIEQDSTRRGIETLNRLKLSTIFPLGLFEAWSFYDFNESCIVYPRAEGDLPFPVEFLNDLDGSIKTKEGNDDFIGTRKYRSGDPSKRIDWKAYARERGLHRKLYEGQSNCELIFNLQQVAELNDIEKGLSQLCKWLIEADANQYKYGLQLNNQLIEPNQGYKHLHQCLRCLALYA